MLQARRRPPDRRTSIPCQRRCASIATAMSTIYCLAPAHWVRRPEVHTVNHRLFWLVVPKAIEQNNDFSPRARPKTIQASYDAPTKSAPHRSGCGLRLCCRASHGDSQVAHLSLQLAKAAATLPASPAPLKLHRTIRYARNRRSYVPFLDVERIRSRLSHASSSWRLRSARRP
jgi:hypothetical protein